MRVAIFGVVVCLAAFALLVGSLAAPTGWDLVAHAINCCFYGSTLGFIHEELFD